MLNADDLKKTKTFETFTEKQLEELSKITVKKAFKTSHKIYRSGTPARNIFVVAEGLVNLREWNPEDKFSIGFETLDEGHLFGCASLTEHKNYTLNALCLEDTQVLAIEADKLFKLCERDPDLGYKIIKEIAQTYFQRYLTAKRQLHELWRLFR